MKKAIVASLATALLVGLSAAGADEKKIVVEGTRIVELADGGSISLGKDGVTYHVDAKGKRVRMKDGEVMAGKDGAKYLHRNDAIWKQITEKGTLAPNR